MFGLADRLYALRKRREGYVEPEIDWRPKVVSHNGKDTSWFCFVPHNVSGRPLLREGIIPAEGKVFVYTISSLNIVKPSPEETIDRLQEIYNDAINRMNHALANGHTLNLLGVSLGNVLSIRASNEINSEIERIVSIVGGARLGLSAWDSILTGRIARQSGCKSPEEYEERLSAFSPINYIDGIDAKKVSIRLGTRDLLIPFDHGKELAHAFLDRAKVTRTKIDYRAYRGADHSGALMLSALDLTY